MPLIRIKCRVLLALLLVITSSCVRDVDLDQAENVVLEPVVDLNLVYFNLEGDRFFDLSQNLPVPTLRDTTEIRFLDDTDIQESLKQVDFLFRFTNTVPRAFAVDYRFIGEQNDTTYTFGTTVPVGSVDEPALHEFLEVVEGDAVVELTKANRLVVEVTIEGPDPVLPGSLEMQSAATYYLEITDRE